MSTPLAFADTSAPVPPTALEHCLRTHGPSLLALAQHLLSDRQAARTALADAFASACTDAENLPAGGLSALRRAVIDASLRRLPVHATERASEAALTPAFLPDGHRSMPAPPVDAAHRRRLQGSEGVSRIRQCIARLPDEWRVVLVLRELEQLDESTTANVLGISTDAVRARLHLARHGLWQLAGLDRAQSA